MTSTLLKALLAACTVLAVLVPSTATASTGAADHMRNALDSHADFSNLQRTAQRHNYVILQPWQTSQLREIKAADPSTNVIMHKNLSGSSWSSNSGRFSTGVSYQEADAEHPEWFLKDASGERITFMGYHWLHAMDIGNPAYQRRWADNVVRELTADDWDGVMLDNTDTTMQHDFASYPTKYPNDAEWRAAMESALAHVGPRIEAAGKLAIPNIGGWGGNPTVGRDWLQYVSGALDEMFVKWGNSAGAGYVSEPRWTAELESLKYAQRAGKDFLAITHSSNDDAAAARYGWATMLLAAEGRASFGLHGDHTHETWFPEYEYEIGEPTGPESRDPSGVHRRVFTNGIVVVNPTDKRLRAKLNGRFSGSGLRNASKVKLAPKAGYILTGTRAGRPTIKPKGTKVRSGTVVAKGKLEGATQDGERIKIQVKGKRGKRSGSARVRKGGRFKARIRLVRAGRYRVVGRHAEAGRKRWPGTLKVRRNQLS